MSIMRTFIDWMKDDATQEDFYRALYDPENDREMYILGSGLVATSVIGTVWIASKVVKGGAKVHRFLNR